MDKKDYEIIAKKIMLDIQLDNGYGHFVGISYPRKWINKIANASEIFFENNPDKFTDEDLENICIGGYDENQDIYGKLKGWDNLNKILNEYFDDGMSIGIVEEKPRLMHTYRKNKSDIIKK